MLKPLIKQLDKNRLKVAFYLALAYNTLFNSSVVIFKFNYYQADIFRAILELSKDFVCVLTFLFIIFLGLSFNKFVLIFSALFLFISGAIASYYLYFWGILPTKEMINNLFNTHFQEAYELVSMKLLLWLFFSILSLWYILKRAVFAKQNSTIALICFIGLVLNIITPQYKILNNYFPIQYLHSSYKYFAKNFTQIVKQNITNKFTFNDLSLIENITGVLVIGESARYDHLSINGYKKNTMPYLSSLSNIYSFKAQSCSNHTYLSVPCLLSRYNAVDLDKIESETGLLSVLTKLKFNTTWIGTQSLMRYLGNNNLGTIYDEVNFTIIPGGSALFGMNDHDAVMLPYIQKILSNDGKQFLVIHLSGSHWNYDNRYPEQFASFSPTCKASSSKIDPSSCDHDKLINSYDNSILYTDFVLHKIIEQLKNKNAFLIYAADHAESLGEGGRYGHGSELVPEQTTIPFIVWLSDEFADSQPEITKALKSRLNDQISHDNIFHSVLDCLGIESDIIDKNLSLCKIAK